MKYWTKLMLDIIIKRRFTVMLNLLVLNLFQEFSISVYCVIDPVQRTPLEKQVQGDQ